MKFRFGMSSVVFMGCIALTIVAWIAFEYYHRKTDVNVPDELISQANSPLPQSFDTGTLKKLYLGKDKFYGSTETNP